MQQFCYYIFVFWGHMGTFQSIFSFEVYLNTIFSIDGFVAFTEVLWVYHNYVTLFIYLISFCILISSVLPSCFSSTLLMAHFGYLHFIRTSSRCCISSLSSLGVEHTTLSLCVRVLITLYLYDRLWWLSHCSYKSVWVGFLYTFVRVPSAWGVIIVSRNGMEPSGLVSSAVNMMEGSTELMFCKIFFSVWLLLYDKSVIYISFPYPRRAYRCCYGSVFKWLHIWISYNWAHRRPQSCPLGCSKCWSQNSKCCINRTPAALWCYWLTWWFYWGVLCPIPAWSLLYQLQMLLK